MSTPAGRIDRTDRTAKRGRRGFWPMRDLPVVFWLLATVVAALLHPVIPAPRWLLIHLTLLGAVTHSIFVWSRYFTDTLLHTPTPSRSSQNNRLALLDLAVLAVVVGVMAAWWPVTLVGAVGVLVAVMWHGLSLLGSLRSALAARFGVVVRFYLGAALLFPVGIVIGAVLARVQADPWHGRLLVAHATVNLLGWIGLTVVGTLVTLWPTMLRTRMAAGIEKAAARALPVLATGIAVAMASKTPTGVPSMSPEPEVTLCCTKARAPRSRSTTCSGDSTPGNSTAVSKPNATTICLTLSQMAPSPAMV